MKSELEAKFIDIDKNIVRQKLTNLHATLLEPEHLLKRLVYNFPTGHAIKGGWVRIRDEGNKITMSIKVVDGNRMEDQKEICLQVNSFSEAQLFLKALGCKQKAYQETKREVWTLDNVEIEIDEWPFLGPFIEIEGQTKEAVQTVTEKLGYDFSTAIFGGVAILYHKKYGTPKDRINNHTSRITFDIENPFI